jgi:hypothetical protein
MEAWFASGRAIDFVIAVLVLEAVVVHGVLRQRALLPWPTFAAGLGLLLAWRLSHAGWGWMWIGPPLGAAGLVHGWDLWRRLPGRASLPAEVVAIDP